MTFPPDRFLHDSPHGRVLRHPLVFDLCFDQSVDDNGQLVSGAQRFAESFAWKREALCRAYERRDWFQWLVLHERYARPEALLGVMQDEAIAPAEWWPLVLDTWNDHEYASGEELWLEIFDAIPDKRRLMSEGERAVFDALPDPVTAWRGLSIPEDEINEIDSGVNWSWTLEIRTAWWFAQRHASADRVPVVLEAEIPREALIAYHTGRNEAELICKPDLLWDLPFATRAFDKLEGLEPLAIGEAA